MGRSGSALLVVTDDATLARDVASWVVGVGRVRHVADARTARRIIDQDRPRLVLVDLLLADFEARGCSPTCAIAVGSERSA